MKISIIVPAYNEEQLIGATLRQITAASEAFARRGWETELIVCDNNSSDRTAELARAAGAQVVFEPINQIARARNRGAAVASGDWFVFVDADSRPTIELFSDVAGQIEAGRCIAGGSTVRLESDSRTARVVTRIWNAISRTWTLLAGSFIFCEAEAFRTVGGFNQELFAGEELDLTQRLKERARDQRKSLVVLHRHPLVTSARKLRLYTWREHLRLLRMASFSRRKTLANREACFMWYDGRR